MLWYEQTVGRPNKKDLWIMTHARNDGPPIDAFSSEAIVFFYYINSVTILVI